MQTPLEGRLLPQKAVQEADREYGQYAVGTHPTRMNSCLI